MLLKKSAIVDKIGDVRFMNGYVAFGRVKLNVYCFETDGVLIDTGSRTLLPQFKEFFAAMDVDQVVITHHHEDHTGGAAHIQKQYNLPIYMNKLTVSQGREKANYPLYRQLFWGRRQPFEATAIANTFTSRSAVLQVIETPGHAADHVAYLNEQTGQLFSGDLYVTPKTRVVLREESMPEIMRSIEKVLTYDFDEMFCCHAGYVKNGRQALMNKWTYLQELEDKILALHKQGYSEAQIQATVFKKKYPITLFSMGEWDSIHIIHSFLAEKAASSFSNGG